MVVRGDGNETCHVETFELAHRSRGRDLGDVAQGNGIARGRSDVDVAEVFERFGIRLRDLHLHVVGNAFARVRPEIRLGKTTRRGGSDHRPRDVLHVHAEQARALAIDLDFHRREFRFLSDLHIAQLGHLAHFCENFFGMGFRHSKVRAADGDLDGRGRAEGHHARGDVGRLEGQAQLRHFLLQHRAQFFLQREYIHARVRLQLHRQPAFLGAAVPEVDEVHGVVRGMHADKADGELDLILADLAFDQRKHRLGMLLGFFHAGSCRGAETQGELIGIGARENFRAETWRNA